MVLCLFPNSYEKCQIKATMGPNLENKMESLIGLIRTVWTKFSHL